MADKRFFEIHELVAYEPPPCPICGTDEMDFEWLNMTVYGHEQVFQPIKHRCLECGNTGLAPTN